MLTGKRIAFIAIFTVTVTVGACKSSLNNGGDLSGYFNTTTCQTAFCANSASTFTSFTGGAVTTLNIVSALTFSDYAGRPVTPTSAIELNLHVTPTANVYLGELNIRYSEGSVVHMGHFVNGTNPNNGNNVHVLTVDQDANNAPTYRFFFEDPAGIIIITAKDPSSGTDTVFSTTLDGTVYYRNFNVTAPNPLYSSYTDYLGNYWPANPNAYCWTGVISTGPYDCRNMRVQPSTWDNHPVTKLGTFTGLDKKTALGL